MPLRLRLCRRDQLPTEGLAAFELAELTQPVLAGVIDGQVIAAAGICPHEDVALIDGSLDGTRLTCPGHGYQFDLTSGACGHDPSLVLRRYPVTLVGDQVWIELIGS